MSANYIAIVVFHWPNAIVVHICYSYYVSADHLGVLFLIKLVAPTRNDKGILSRLATINLIVAIKERAIRNQKRHLHLLMHHLEPMLVWKLADPYTFVVSREHLVIVMEHLNELFRLNVINPDFHNGERRLTLPPLMDSEVPIPFLMHYRYLASDIKVVLCSVQQLLLNLHSATYGVFVNHFHHL